MTEHEQQEIRRVRNLKICGLKFQKGVKYALTAICGLLGASERITTIFEAPETYLVGEAIIDPSGIIQEKEISGVKKPDENRVVETELLEDGTMVENIYDASNVSKATLVSLLKDTDGNLKEQLGEPIETNLKFDQVNKKKIAYVYEILNSEPVVSPSEKGGLALSIATSIFLGWGILYCIEIKTGLRYKVLRDNILKNYPDEEKITPLDPQKKRGIFK